MRIKFADKVRLVALAVALVYFGNRWIADDDVAPAPIARAATFETTCAEGSYRLYYQGESATVRLEHEGLRRVVKNIATTPFGAAILRRPLDGRFILTCLHPGVHVAFSGFEIDDVTRRPVSYRTTFNSGSAWESDFAEAADYLHWRLYR